MKKLSIYLAGNMIPNPQVYWDWINRIKEDFNETQYNLTWAKAVGDYDGQFIVHHDLARLKKSDIVIVNLGVQSINHHMTGVIVEVYEAYKQNKPIYTYTPKNLITSDQFKSPWINQFITKNFKSYNELLNFLLNKENLPF